MAKNLAGMVTFGNLQFTKLTIESVKETTKSDIDFFVVVGKPEDTETIEWLVEQGIPHKVHERNFGFPYSVNDLYDYAWKENDYDNLLLMGNDIVCYPGVIDSLINLAGDSDYEVISALQYDVRDLTREFPETKEFFEGHTLVINDFSSKPWEKFTNYSEEPQIADMQLYDIQNLCLYTRKAFETIGYTDVNFYPAYYIDNDYARRIVNSEIRCCSMVNARFFHFWSRTIHQGSGGSTSGYFVNNRKYYTSKWGGDFGHETKTPNVLIDNRIGEVEQIEKWKQVGSSTRI